MDLQTDFFQPPDRERLVAHIGSTFNVDASSTPQQTVFDTFRKQHLDGYTNIPFLDTEQDPTLDSFVSYLLTTFPRNKQQQTFAIDGTSCCGKSTLLAKFQSYKVNELLPQDIKTYNYDAVCAFSYMQLSKQLSKSLEYVAFDRSTVANLAYQYVYYLMNYIANLQEAGSAESLTTLKLPTGESPFALCENYTRLHHLEALLEHIHALRLNILILVDSNIDSVMARMTERGQQLDSEGDLAKSGCRLYILAQNIAFAYLAHKCNLPCIDLHFLRTLAEENEDQLHSLWNTIETYLASQYNLEKFARTNKSIELPDNLSPFSSHLQDYPKLQLVKRVLSKR